MSFLKTIAEFCKPQKNDINDDNNFQYQHQNNSFNYQKNGNTYQNDNNQINQKKRQEENKNDNPSTQDRQLNRQVQDEENQLFQDFNQNSRQNIQSIKYDQNTMNNSSRNFSDNQGEQNKQQNQTQLYIGNQQQQQQHLETMYRTGPSVLQQNREQKNNQIQNGSQNYYQINQNQNQPQYQQNRQQQPFYEDQKIIKNLEVQNPIQNNSIRIKQVTQSYNYNNYESIQNKNQQLELQQCQVLQNNPNFNFNQNHYEKANYQWESNVISIQSQNQETQWQNNNYASKLDESNQQNIIQSRISKNSQESYLNDQDSMLTKIKTKQVLCVYCQNEIQQKYTQLKCQHFYCNECLKELLRSQSFQKDCIKYLCCCSKPINLQLFTLEKDKIISLLNEKLNINQINLLKQKVQQQHNVKTCRNKHCQFFAIMRDDLMKEYFYCPLCLEKQYDNIQKK